MRNKERHAVPCDSAEARKAEAMASSVKPNPIDLLSRDFGVSVGFYPSIKMGANKTLFR